MDNEDDVSVGKLKDDNELDGNGDDINVVVNNESNDVEAENDIIESVYFDKTDDENEAFCKAMPPPTRETSVTRCTRSGGVSK